ncbi:MAG TPA: class I SAM-dependent methyltransferase [Polyangiaceae bacterium]|jgi:SAM-dependent methyltransferase|nr:class I SAM-dependent methyltransferase [Polyangiaceae bacterium]
MSSVKQHYEALLGSVYSWYVSAAGDPWERAAAFLARHGLDRAEHTLDLGAGFGAHAVALARSGKRVTAVDFDRTLLAELRESAREHAERVEVVEEELLAFVRGAARDSFGAVLCLGDTLTHLESARDAEALIRESARCLTRGGQLALSYRDSSGFSAEGVARFREVARDATRTLHCLLEPVSAERLRVTDIVTEVTPEGPRTRLGDYFKLRLAPERVVAWAQAAGLREVRRAEEAGMLTLVFEKPS